MKYRNLGLITFLLLVSIILFLNCSAPGMTGGEDDVIYVFADSLDWTHYEDPFNEIFGQLIRTPIMESEYVLIWKPFEEFKNYQKYKNIFIIGRLDGKDGVSENIRDLLNEEIINGVREGKYFYIPKIDAWTRDQYVMIFVAESTDDMIQKVIDLGELAYQDFRKYYFQRLKAKMFSQMEQKKLQEHLENHFPFTMRLQHDYFIANESLEENFVWIRRMNPDRSISVHWIPFKGDLTLNPQWVIEERNRLAAEFYSGDIVVEDETRALSFNFKGWNALKLEGIWRNDSLIVGGPFRNITFLDSATNRIYMIDYYVQAIGKRKVPYLDQLTVLAYTFQPLPKPRKQHVE